ncbi:MAG: transglycosylase domain-containing protein [Proteocatella sp.]
MDKDIEQKTKKKKKKKINFLKLLSLILAFVIIIGTVSTLAMALVVIKTAEPIDPTKISEQLDESSFIFDDKGVLIEKISNGEYSSVVPLQQIPKDLQNAVVAIEDERFYEHNGVDIKRVFGALWYDIKTMSLAQGASTITMQVAKNLYTTMDKTWTRKLKDIYYAIEIEKVLSKNQILHAYLNTIGLGRGTRGVQAAAHIYFNKDVSELNLAECAMIAGITKNPYKYSVYITAPITFNDDFSNMQVSLIPSNEETPEPTSEEIEIYGKLLQNGLISSLEYDQLNKNAFYARKAVLNPDSKERQEVVLKMMLKNNYISETQYNEALNYPIEVKLGKRKQSNISSYFGDKVKEETIVALKSVGYSEEDANDILYSGGLRIHSTLDSRIQGILEDEINNPSNFPGSRIDSDGIPQPQVASVIMDQYTGQVKALVGGRGISGSKIYNRALNPRQPGSSIKPLSVYLPALENGFTGASGIVDKPIKNEKGEYWPKNYSSYEGPTTLRNLVIKSSNVGAVQVAQKLGTSKMIDYLKNMGISTLVTRSDNSSVNDENLSLALGGMSKGVTPLDLTAAYASIANGGTYTKPIFITKIENANGTILYENKPETRQVASPQAAYIMTDIMKDVVNRGTGGRARVNNMVTVGKTGTTNDEKDIWFSGYTPYYTSALWIGEDQPKDLNKTSDVPSRLWGRIMNRVHEGLPSKNFDRPSDLSSATVCRESGLIAGANCTRTYSELFMSGTVPNKVCDIHESVVTDGLLDEETIENSVENDQKDQNQDNSNTENSTPEENKPSVETPSTDNSNTENPSEDQNNTGTDNENTGTPDSNTQNNGNGLF